MESEEGMDEATSTRQMEMAEEEARITSPGRQGHRTWSSTDVPAYGSVETPRMMKQRNVKPRDYDGQGSWRTYRSHFERVASLNQWKEEKLEFLWIHLSGIALSFVEGLPQDQQTDYETVCKALEFRFGAERMATIHKAELLAKKREPGETLSALGQEIRRLVNGAYPQFPPAAQEEIAIERFLDAMEKPQLRRNIHESEPKTLDQAVEKGLQMEAWEVADEKKHGTSQVRMAETEQIRLIKDLQGQIEGWEKNRQEKKWKCFNCGKEGHIARRCPQKRAAEGNRGEVTCYSCGKRGHMSRQCPGN